jgi:hypothetical protein
VAGSFFDEGSSSLLKSSILIFGLLASLIAGCASQEPLEITSATSSTSPIDPATDRSVIAEAVGNASAGTRPLAWANPGTGSAGVIEYIETGAGRENGCRNFTASRQALDGKSRFNGVACPSGQSWKLSDDTGG